MNTRITPTRALLFATILGVLGAALLVLYTNLLTFSVALCGFVVYVALYTPLKRISEHAVLIGALAGATPPVVGYVAVANSLDAASLLLFMILIAWQMVHFLAIALYREDEYRAAQVPVFPIRQGAVATKALMTVYVFIFAFGAWALPYVGGQLGLFYRAGVGALALFWLALSIYGFYAVDERSWARLNFFYSLVVIVGFSVMLAMQ